MSPIPTRQSYAASKTLREPVTSYETVHPSVTNLTRSYLDFDMMHMNLAPVR
jgi:hypothetical protein